MKPTFIQRLKSLSTRSILLIATSAVVLIATIVALSGTISSASRRMEKKLYGEEIGNNHLRYKHGDHIYKPETGKILDLLLGEGADHNAVEITGENTCCVFNRLASAYL